LIGVEERINKANIRVVRVHYTAHEDRRSEEWLAKAKGGYTSARDWEREQEVNWRIASGLPVFADVFNRELHVAKKSLMLIQGVPVYRNWDFGLTPACVWFQIDSMGRINVLDELVTWNGRGPMKQMGIERFAPLASLKSKEEFEGHQFRDYADPAGWAKAQTDEKSCVEIMHKLGIHPVPGPVTFTLRKQTMTDTLGMIAGGRAKLMVDPGCHMIIAGFEGAYKYEQVGETNRYKETIEKNAWSHPMDALTYGIGAMFSKGQPRDEDDDTRDRRNRDRVTGY
jgi:hypothetical protein